MVDDCLHTSLRRTSRSVEDNSSRLYRSFDCLRTLDGHFSLVFESLIRTDFCWRFKQLFVLQALTVHPRLVGVGEINSLGHRRVAGPPQFIHQTRPRNTEILNLEL